MALARFFIFLAALLTAAIAQEIIVDLQAEKQPEGVEIYRGSYNVGGEYIFVSSRNAPVNKIRFKSYIFNTDMVYGEGALYLTVEIFSRGADTFFKVFKLFRINAMKESYKNLVFRLQDNKISLSSISILRKVVDGPIRLDLHLAPNHGNHPMLKIKSVKEGNLRRVEYSVQPSAYMYKGYRIRFSCNLAFVIGKIFITKIDGIPLGYTLVLNSIAQRLTLYHAENYMGLYWQNKLYIRFAVPHELKRIFSRLQHLSQGNVYMYNEEAHRLKGLCNNGESTSHDTTSSPHLHRLLTSMHNISDVNDGDHFVIFTPEKRVSALEFKDYAKYDRISNTFTYTLGKLGSTYMLLENKSPNEPVAINMVPHVTRVRLSTDIVTPTFTEVVPSSPDKKTNISSPTHSDTDHETPVEIDEDFAKIVDEYIDATWNISQVIESGGSTLEKSALEVSQTNQDAGPSCGDVDISPQMDIDIDATPTEGDVLSSILSLYDIDMESCIDTSIYGGLNHNEMAVYSKTMDTIIDPVAKGIDTPADSTVSEDEDMLPYSKLSSDDVHIDEPTTAPPLSEASPELQKSPTSSTGTTINTKELTNSSFLVTTPDYPSASVPDSTTQNSLVETKEIENKMPINDPTAFCGEHGHIEHSMTLEFSLSNETLKAGSNANVFDVTYSTGCPIALVVFTKKLFLKTSTDTTLVIQSACNAINHYTSFTIPRNTVSTHVIVAVKDVRAENKFIICRTKNAVIYKVESFLSTLGLWHIVMVHMDTVDEYGDLIIVTSIYQELGSGNNTRYVKMKNYSKEWISFLDSMRPY
ncbi:2-succinyl-5-enolpyruvyl-6-hydroxy-3-cyclohexene-1-carboxylate synthase, putative [Babesia ovis]|uniref:2-succinyl-5-enolpyruvyl-6-hydroxy-3-cyclohexene-1-carboxylate synthase, putative n=1 Tax=Babesia ovis TaxID=5869 RepID=A0A9W5TEB2_BABOV|nr:2-succinyl-5-enolpyruvyl-6-hydroxy-3-cyclohexene-1-carboxylate synthase, putative [Babesia ovis]